MGNRRMTPLTKAFSKKAENHARRMAIYFMHHNFWKQHEFRAFKEFVRANKVHYEYIGLVPHWQQVAVRILG